MVQSGRQSGDGNGGQLRYRRGPGPTLFGRGGKGGPDGPAAGPLLEETAARCSGETLILPADLVEEAHRKTLVDRKP